MMCEHIAVFVDTNALLHYPPISETDWLGLFDCDSVTLILCGQVIKELDEKKTHPTLGNRAKRTIKDIDRADEAGGRVRGGVDLKVFQRPLRREEFELSLSPDDGDDRILQLVAIYAREHPDETVGVCSEDAGIRFKCKARGVLLVKPDPEKRLPDPQDEQGRGIKKLQAKVAELQAGMPEISVVVECRGYFDDSRTSGRIVLRREALSGDVEEIIDEERRRLRDALVMNLPYVLEESPDPYDDGFTEPGPVVHPLEAEVGRYLEKYAEFLRTGRIVADELRRGFVFKLTVKNSGGGPADDVRVKLRLPPVLKYLWLDKDRKLGTMPKWPNKPEPPDVRIRAARATPQWTRLGLEAIRTPVFRGPFAPRCEFIELDGSYCIDITVPNLSHHDPEVFEDVLAVFSDWDTAVSFEGTAVITAKQLRKARTQPVPFIVES